jgi:hypothetical protein
MQALEAGLLTCGSSYSPTPSQPSPGQWLALLAFVPAYSGASVRDLHPLPVSVISIARISLDPTNHHLLRHLSSILLLHQDQETGDAGIDNTKAVLGELTPGDT